MFFFFFFNDTATTEIYTLSLHDALPIFVARLARVVEKIRVEVAVAGVEHVADAQAGRRDDLVHAAKHVDRKSTRLNSSHGYISYAVFCLKKKKKIKQTHPSQK